MSQSTADLLTVNSFCLPPKLIRPLRQRTGGGPQMYVVMIANQQMVIGITYIPTHNLFARETADISDYKYQNTISESREPLDTA